MLASALELEMWPSRDCVKRLVDHAHNANHLLSINFGDRTTVVLFASEWPLLVLLSSHRRDAHGCDPPVHSSNFR